MAPAPSIQTFYKSEVPKSPSEDQPSPELVRSGDGFTEEELADALDPLNRNWNPEREYNEMGIGELVPGPKAVTFVGRIANLSTITGRSSKQPKAAGWHYLILKDDAAAISVTSSPILS